MNSVTNFFARPASPLPLALLRILLSTILIVQAFLLLPDLLELYGVNGLLQGNLNNFLMQRGTPRVETIQVFLAAYGIGPDRVVHGLFLAYVGSLATLLIGYRCRLFAIASWFFHFLLIYSTGALSSYGVDSYAHIFLFYFIFMPIGAAWSVDALRGVSFPAPEYNRLSLRILQLHLCLSYLVAGVAKSVGSQWRDGEAIWRAMMMPDFAQGDPTWLAQLPWLAMILAWTTVLFEATYPIFVWFKPTRKLWVGTLIAMHVGIFFFLGLKTFALFLIALNVALFLTPAELSPRPAVA